MIVHNQYYLSQSAEISEHGYWDNDNAEPEYQDTLCPVCSGSALGADNTDVTLKYIVLDRTLYTHLHTLWLQLKNAHKPHELSKMIYESVGIPLTNKELKELLIEELI
jgi:hypothetical protein